MKQSILFLLPALGLDVPYDSPTASYSSSCYRTTAIFDVFPYVKNPNMYMFSNAAIMRASSLKLKSLKKFGKRQKLWRRLLK